MQVDIAIDWDARQRFRTSDYQNLPQLQLDGKASPAKIQAFCDCCMLQIKAEAALYRGPLAAVACAICSLPSKIVAGG